MKVCEGCPDRFEDCMTKTECQQRVERIFREIEANATESIAVKDSDTNQQMDIRAIPEAYWQVLKKQEGIG